MDKDKEDVMMTALGTIMGFFIGIVILAMMF